MAGAVLLAAAAAPAAPPPVALEGTAAEVSGREVVRVKRLGRAKAPVSARLRLGAGSYGEVREGTLRLAGTFEQKGRGGRTLVAADDASSEAALAAYLATRTRDVYATAREGDAAIVVTLVASTARAKVNRRASRIVLKRRVRFEAAAPALGQTWRGSYKAELAGALAEAPAGDPVADGLSALGVDTTATPRLDDDGEALAETYGPLGTVFELGATAELFLLGFRRASDPSLASLLAVAPDTPPAGEPPSSYTVSALSAPPPADTPWALSSGPSAGVPAMLRAATAGDVDGDGLGEVVVAFFAGQTLTLHTIDEAEAGFVTAETALGSMPGVVDLDAVAADVDGDGTAEVALALATATTVELRIVARQGAGFTVTDTIAVAARSLVGSQLFTSLAAGNLDRDRGEEIAVVVNEGYPLFDSTQGVARAVLFDDGGAGHAVLHDAIVRGEVGVQVHTAAVADVALGDVDGDGMDEVLLGGLTNVWTGGGCTSYGHLLVALDDARHALAPIGARFFDYFLAGCDDANSWKLRYVHVNALDVDRDGVAEVAANWFVYDDWRNAAPWTELHTIPLDEFFGSGYGRIDRSTSAVVTADVTGDGGDDVILTHQDAAAVSVWTDDASTGWGEVTHEGGPLVATQATNTQNPMAPLIVPVNVTNDGPVLRYTDGEYRLVFMEPVVIAALASPPCGIGIGQVTDDCRTQYGTAVSDTVTAETTFTVSAGFHFGVKGGVSVLGVDVLEAEVRESITARASVFASAAYTIEKTVVFTTGPLEDGVVFTTVPYDQYTYTVVSDPNPDLVGTAFVLSIPREPITLLAERRFFNATVPPGTVSIDDRVFAHTIGVLGSYPTVAEKNSLLSQYGYPPVPLLFQTTAQSVGQGTGNTMVSLTFEELFTAGAGFEIEYEFAAETTVGGVMAGYEVGTSVGASLAYSKGVKTLYGGTIGSIDAANFPQNLYSFGLFTYAYPDPASGQTFEVVNYWVE